MVNANVSATDAKELVTLLRQNPDKLNFGSGGIGTPMHLYGEVLKNQFPQVHPRSLPRLRAGDRGISVRPGAHPGRSDPIHPAAYPVGQAPGDRRGEPDAHSATLPNVPTFAEAGIDGADAISWFGLVAPRGTPKAVAERLSAAVQTALKDPAVIAKLQAL